MVTKMDTHTELLQEPERKTKKKKKLTESFPAKVFVFFVMIICVGIGTFSGYATIWNLAEDVYEEDFICQLENAYYWQAREDQYSIYNLCVQGNFNSIDDFCRGKNISVEIYDSSNHLIWGNYQQYNETMVFSYDDFAPIELKHEDTGRIWEAKVRIDLYIDKAYPYADVYSAIYRNIKLANEYAILSPFITFGMLVLVLICFIFLMCSAGHRKDEQTGDYSVGKGLFHGIYLDILLAVFLVAMIAVTVIVSEAWSWGSGGTVFLSNGIVLTIWAMLIAILGTFFCMEFAIRIKRGGFLKYTLIYGILRIFRKALRMCLRGIKAVFRGIVDVLQNLPALWIALLAFAVLCIFEFFGMMIFWEDDMILILWFLEKIVLLPVICYLGLVSVRLFKAGNALAEGNLSYHVDTSKMILGYKLHGNHLNSIGEGMTKAVTERLKSEHLKTELITNVSHDLKTPLTSIINYSDLLCRPDTEPEKAKEYAEVLNRQSVRLKKLLDDLLEVSKASTGNLPTEFSLCDIKVLLTQVTGEYEQRLEERQLKLLLSQPEEDVQIMADSRHMWRIFDNLLGNVCKYALPGSRVYLNVEMQEDKVHIIFRNISEYPLEVDAQELQERFVRGDKSRHKEGNGLGLSIAISLAQLQRGNLKIVTDGDLFKAILEFPLKM